MILAVMILPIYIAASRSRIDELRSIAKERFFCVVIVDGLYEGKHPFCLDFNLASQFGNRQ